MVAVVFPGSSITTTSAKLILTNGYRYSSSASWVDTDSTPLKNHHLGQCAHVNGAEEALRFIDECIELLSERILYTSDRP